MIQGGGTTTKVFTPPVPSGPSNYCGVWPHCGPALTATVAGLTGCCNCYVTGQQDWNYSWLGCWEDPVLCLWGMPFCCPLVCNLYSKTLAAALGTTPDELCLISLGMCCYCPCCTPCYFAGARTALRRK